MNRKTAMTAAALLLGAGMLGSGVVLAQDAPAPEAAEAQAGAPDAPWGRGHGMFDFGAMDADDDGRVTQDELRAYRQGRIEGLDANGDGLLSAEEMVAHRLRLEQGRIEARVNREITARDLNGDGMLSAEELSGPALPMAMFDRLDRDGDGAVTQAEIDAMRADRREGRRGRDGGPRMGHRGGHWMPWMRGN